MIPITTNPPVTTEAMTVQRYPFSDDAKRGIETFLIRRIPVTAIDFYPNPASRHRTTAAQLKEK